MKQKFSLSGLPQKSYGKKKEIKIEFWLLNDIVAKSLTAKAGSFDVYTVVRLEMMTTITTGFKVNCSEVLINFLLAMISSSEKQNTGFSIQIRELMEHLRTPLGSSISLHHLKVLTGKSIHTYKAKNVILPEDYIKIEKEVQETMLKKKSSPRKPSSKWKLTIQSSDELEPDQEKLPWLRFFLQQKKKKRVKKIKAGEAFGWANPRGSNSCCSNQQSFYQASKSLSQRQLLMAPDCRLLMPWPKAKEF